MICNYIVHHYFLYARTTYTYKINVAAGCSWHLLRIRRPVSIWSAVIRWGLAATSVWGGVRLRGTPNRGAPGKPPNGHFHRGTKMASSSTLDLGVPMGYPIFGEPHFLLHFEQMCVDSIKCMQLQEQTTPVYCQYINQNYYKSLSCLPTQGYDMNCTWPLHVLNIYPLPVLAKLNVLFVLSQGQDVPFWHLPNKASRAVLQVWTA